MIWFSLTSGRTCFVNRFTLFEARGRSSVETADYISNLGCDVLPPAVMLDRKGARRNLASLWNS